VRGYWTAEHKRRNGRGFTLVELIVVLAIVALLTALAVPGLARLGAFSDDTLGQESRQLFELLAAARVYATTYNVRTAVVYNLDTYKSPQVNPNNDPLPLASFVNDTITGAPTRFITAATMMYALPDSEIKFAAAISPLFAGGTQEAFVPATGKEWQWREFDDGVALLMKEDPTDPGNVYASDAPRFDATAGCSGVGKLGMYCGVPVILDFDTADAALKAGAPAQDQAQYFARFPAHVFTPDGRVEATASDKERFTFYLGYRPDEPIERRLTNPDFPAFVFPGVDDNGDPISIPNLRVVPMEIYRSTGRVKIAS
jgi:prepilin-type N-terminal cleavage/methylation domain-containing protein